MIQDYFVTILAIGLLVSSRTRFRNDKLKCVVVSVKALWFGRGIFNVGPPVFVNLQTSHYSFKAYVTVSPVDLWKWLHVLNPKTPFVIHVSATSLSVRDGCFHPTCVGPVNTTRPAWVKFCFYFHPSMIGTGWIRSMKGTGPAG